MNESLESLSRASKPHGHRQKIPAWLIPAGIGLGFALLFLALFRDRILPAQEVEVVAVLATQNDPSSGDSASESPADLNGPMAFQASGWVEPDPLPIKATALIDGVVDEVHVLEGELVEKGQQLATLISEDFKLSEDAAREALGVRQAESKTHLEAIEAERRKVTAAEADAEAAAALVTETGDRAQRIKGLSSGALAEADRVAIRTAHQKAKAAHAAALAMVERAKAELKLHVAEHSVLQGEVKGAEVAVAQAELALERTSVSSPVAGRVLRLLAAPGQKKMLGMDDPDSATVAILYQPEHLQVRVDVALADAAGLQIGQKARIRCSLLPNTVFRGEVTRITGEADLQRNTLQAKVRINDPSDQLRPEMLCRVEFLNGASAGSGASPATTGSLCTWVPESALAGDRVWLCDPDSKRVNPRTVTLGNQSKDGFSLVRDGLRPGEWVVLSPKGLEDGQRVKPQLVEP